MTKEKNAATRKKIITVESVMDYMGSLTRRTSLFMKTDMRLLQIIRADLNRVIELREHLIQEEAALDKQRQEKIQEHLSLLKKDGIDPDELKGSNTKPRKRPSIGKIRTFRVEGELIHYKGVGIYPKVLRDIIDSEGESALEKYEINED
ncbi:MULTISPECIES: H-NS family nucleoid-associated regulatory protein [Citrobacter]|uniref:H-NS family histone-like protein n=1 Tax=Citrobacter TaxID=544 RepID=UPI002577B5AE|nr:H-NS family nucleoid-associated regulatory protein [Citrobacter sp. Cpo150]MDM2765757.1 H-NS histone family protein [Citrobacter sp. Cpo150]